MASALFWRKLAKEFHDLYPNGIGIVWKYVPPEYHEFHLIGNISDHLARARFNELCARAGKALGANDPRYAWLRETKNHCKSENKKQSYEVDSSGNRYICFTGLIANPCEASEVACLAMEVKAIEEKATALHPINGTENHAPTPPASEESIATERKRLLAEYKNECRRAGVKVTDDMIAQAASPTWSERTQVTWWKRNDPSSKPAADHAIRRVLRNKPHLPKP